MDNNRNMNRPQYNPGIQKKILKALILNALIQNINKCRKTCYKYLKENGFEMKSKANKQKEDIYCTNPLYEHTPESYSLDETVKYFQENQHIYNFNDDSMI